MLDYKLVLQSILQYLKISAYPKLINHTMYLLSKSVQVLKSLCRDVSP